MRVYNIQVNHLHNPVGIDGSGIYITWCVEEGLRQSAFRIRVLDGEKVWEDSGQVVSARMEYGLCRDIPAKSCVRVIVDVWDEENRVGEGGEISVVTGIAPTQWLAKWINPELVCNTKAMKPASYLKKDFVLQQKPERAMLYMTCHGIMNVYINGVEATNRQFMPGPSQENRRLMVETLEVMPFLRVGNNEIVVTVGDGWHRGSMGYDQKKNVFGTDVALLCQLEADGKVVLISDETWLASQDGPLGINDFMRGEEYDARRENSQTWHNVKVEYFGYDKLYPTDTVPICPHEEFTAKLLVTPSGQKVLDFGQNIAGYVRMEFDASEGQRVHLIHGETLDADGNFTIQNFQAPHVRTRQEVIYICKEGHNSYHPTKTYMGFRYVLLDTQLDIPEAAFTAVAVYSDMRSTAEFSCGIPEVNQLFRNALWSMKGNFIGVPTDCPTREKSGFSGDCQVFVDAGMYLMDSYPVYAKWLREQAATQMENGCVAQIAPSPSMVQTEQDGGIGWSDSFVIVPWKLAERYNDFFLLKELYAQIKKWIAFRMGQAEHIRECNRKCVPEQYQRYVLDNGWLWGEWLEPGVNLDAYIADLKEHGELEISTAFYAYTMELAAKIAEKLGEEEDASVYETISKKAKNAYHEIFLKKGKITEPVRQCRYVRPVAFGLLTEKEEQETAAALSRRIQENGNKLNTGFLTTAHLCRVLSDHGKTDTAYDLLLQTQSPGWLYSVLQGATTIPENWNAYSKEGTRIDSFNHYSYGAVAGWLLDSVCGIRMEWGQLIIAPKPDHRLGYAKAEYDSPLGKVISGWKYEEQKVRYEISVPANAEAEVRLPDGRSFSLSAGTYNF